MGENAMIFKFIKWAISLFLRVTNPTITNEDIIPVKIVMTQSVFDEIKNTIGTFPAETGGILGMTGDTINHFYYDEYPDDSSYSAYTPNCDAINACLEKWTDREVIYVGCIHSHPSGICSPSYPDKLYAQRILNNNSNFDKSKKYLYIPIVQSIADTGNFKMYSFIAYYKNNIFIIAPINLVIDK
jgi:proteasome lid subunit RPN8/RPN11